MSTNHLNLGRYLIFDIMSELCFGRSFNLQLHRENRYMTDGICKLHKFNSAFVQSVELSHYHLEKIFSPHGLYYGWRFMTMVHESFSSGFLNNQSKSNCLLSSMSRVKSSVYGEGYSAVELWSECKFLMVTGSGSPASALAALLYYLSQYPSCYERAAEEIRATFTSASEICSGPKMDSCRYLHACINETLRMSPPVGATLWREVEHEGIEIDGHFIPPGCDVGIGIYSIHHNETYFPDPFVFQPERWLPNKKQSISGAAQKAFNPFSMGPRHCLGRQIALMELSDIVSLLLWHLDFRMAHGERDRIGIADARKNVREFAQEDHIFSFFDGPHLEFRPR